MTLARYTHKIAISNYRILNIDKENKKVTFSLKNYRKSGKKTTMTLSVDEFIRRFSLHILPKGFTKIRHYGFLSSAWKKEKLPALQESFDDFKLKMEDIYKSKENTSLLNKCRFCKQGNLVLIAAFDKRGPPQEYIFLIKNTTC